MRHHAADGGGRKPTENQTVVWWCGKHGEIRQKVKHAKDRNRKRGAAVYCAWLQDGRKKNQQ